MRIQKFKNEIEKESELALKLIKKTDDDIRIEAATHFREIVNRFYDSEETKKTKHLEETKDN